MGKKHDKKADKGQLLPFPLINDAINGNVDAINKVLKYYEGYIITLSTKKFIDEQGKARWYVDEELRKTLETKLITGILSFKIA